MFTVLETIFHFNAYLNFSFFIVSYFYLFSGKTYNMLGFDYLDVLKLFIGNKVWYLQWRLECPKDWDLPSVVQKLNINKRLLRGFFNIDFVHSEVQREIVLETNTETNVFNSYSSAELAFKTFIGTIVKVCELETTEPFDMSVTTSVLAVTERSGKASFVNFYRYLNFRLYFLLEFPLFRDSFF